MCYEVLNYIRDLTDNDNNLSPVSIIWALEIMTLFFNKYFEYIDDENLMSESYKLIYKLYDRLGHIANKGYKKERVN